MDEKLGGFPDGDNLEEKPVDESGELARGLFKKAGEVKDVPPTEVLPLVSLNLHDFLRQVNWIMRDKIFALTPGTVAGSSDPKNEVLSSLDYLIGRVEENWLNYQKGEGFAYIDKTDKKPGRSIEASYIISFFESCTDSLVPEDRRKMFSSIIEKAVDETERAFPGPHPES